MLVLLFVFRFAASARCSYFPYLVLLMCNGCFSLVNGKGVNLIQKENTSELYYTSGHARAARTCLWLLQVLLLQAHILRRVIIKNNGIIKIKDIYVFL